MARGYRFLQIYDLYEVKSSITTALIIANKLQCFIIVNLELLKHRRCLIIVAKEDTHTHQIIVDDQ